MIASTSASQQISYSLRLLHSCKEAEPAWRELEENGHCSVFQSFDWLSEWQECVGRPLRVRPLLVLIEDSNGAPWMLLPLGLEHRRLARVLVWLGGEFSDYLGPIVGVECPAGLLGPGYPELWRRLVSEMPTFAYAHLQRMLPRLGERPNPFMALGARTDSRSPRAFERKGHFHRMEGTG